MSRFILVLLFGLLLPLVVNPPSPAAAQTGASPEMAQQPEGKIIRSVRIRVAPIFDSPGSNWLYRKANSLKASTKQHVVRRELYFKEGDHYSNFLVQESLRNLRAQKFLRRVQIVPRVEGDVVDVDVIVQDTWTFIPQGTFSSGTGRDKTSLGISESDLLGYGKRVEFAGEKDESRKILQGVWEDNRVGGSDLRLMGAAFQRSDGEQFTGYVGRPFRSLVEKEAWRLDGDHLNSAGRLFEAGTERYIFHQQKTEWNLRETLARGDPEKDLSRYSYGYQYIEDEFRQADAEDYANLGLEPDEVSNDPALLASDRRFSGPAFSYERIRPDFISMNYIDRFDRVEDYDLGHKVSAGVTIAPDFLGSMRDTLLASGTYTVGHHLSPDSFAREEFGGASRFDRDGFSNSLLRFQSRYYKVLGPLYFFNASLGRHTLAAGFDLDYGSKLDKDREFLLGGDNGLRGYEARSFTGNKRAILNLEDRIHIAEDVLKLFSVGGAFFLDAGGATAAPLETIVTRYLYADVGAGLRFAFPRSSGGRVLRIDIALPLRHGPEGSDVLEPRLIISGGQVFNSHLSSETIGPEKANVGVGFDD